MKTVYDETLKTSICVGDKPAVPHISGAKPLDGFRLLLDFANGERRIFDASALFTSPLYAKLKNRVFFDRVRFDAMCVYWDDETDIAPELLYGESPKTARFRHDDTIVQTKEPSNMRIVSIGETTLRP